MTHRLPLLVCILASSALAAAERPNILWITAEDMSPTLGCYGDDYTTTPHIDRLATESVKYSHAFASAPVCSPSRSCLINGCYAPYLGTQQMRSAYPIPAEMKGFPSFLRAAGYFTSNAVKTDYNTSRADEIRDASWSRIGPKADWRPRGDAPFFSVINLMTSHQSRSMVWPREKFEAEVQSRLAPEQIHDPAKAPLPPYYVDTPVVRRTVARYYDCVTAMDMEVGEILRQLEDDGLADDTIVFFYSDHGSGMPRHKRALLDSGMHVPLLVRFPAKHQHLAPAKPGQTIDRLVSFVDFGPTVLSLAGVDVPDYMQGIPFLGEAEGEPRRYVFGHRDRVDEAIDCARSVRSGRWLYIRNFMPHLGYNQFTAWPDQGEIRHEFYRLTDEKTMTAAQWCFAGPTRPVEELYDCEADPLNLENLAGKPAAKRQRDAMREVLRERLLAEPDFGMLPESQLAEIAQEGAPLDQWRTDADLRDALARTTETALTDWRAVSGRRILDELRGGNAAQRYWALIALGNADAPADQTARALRKALQDDDPAVRIEAARLVARDDIDAALPVLTAALKLDNMVAVLHAARTIELLGQPAAAARPAMEALVARCERIRPPGTSPVVVDPEKDMAMFVGFTANGFLARLESGWTELFDGASLDGWEARAEGEVAVEEGEIRILSKGKNLWLVHEGVFTNFELEVEARMPAAGYNSGIGFRCTGAAKPKGYQCEIENAKSGMIYAIGSGWVWPRGPEESKRFKAMAKDSFQVGEWNHFRVRCEGTRVRIWVNDVLTADVDDERHKSGSVALQHHGKGDTHRFRNVRLRVLP